ncbi:hypothetical protein TVAG_045940 [Trichomonas vaginalis G3]|uniref:Uncharacterized protein n=1 Tax=Trichomonas vaginalis (strain ATCC PRA-98 / G3) TaxID=412133 RepID=A2DMG5_TRIV3|nr:hypothetical protein TVAGG3_0336890 [Trichomonas vaginalis G3]EAY18392.1 hypothetical protein TVAG_045940 [Trichomonas vaginalis G3]KAI5530337.1 hypothetical protein TVAGG3_0336890 [Trichomonas vaginalis G3]|eukprot:XP_001579378.1 hypothetical protein [Trichomonas vaginalis G3]
MSLALERRCQIFQKKLEQNLMIADTQIQQLMDYYTSLEAQNTELSDQITRLDNQFQQEVSIKQGSELRRRAQLKSKLASLKDQYRQEISDLKHAQALQLQEIQKDFENSLQKLQNDDKKQTDKIEKVYNQTITELETTLEKTQQDITIADNEKVDYQTKDIYEAQIQDLQNVLAQKNQERVNNLLSSKQKLLDCVTSLEENEKEHKLKMDQMREKLLQEEAAYKQKIQSIKDSYSSTLGPIKKQITNQENQYRKVKKEIHDFKSEASIQLNNMNTVFERTRQDLTHYSKISQQSTVIEKPSANIDTRSEELRRIVRQKEETLNKEQEINNKLKREICRLRFERRTAKSEFC